MKENDAWFIYAIGVNFTEGIFMHVKSWRNTFYLVDKLGKFELVNPNMKSDGFLKCPVNLW